MMAAPLYNLTSLPTTLSTLPLSSVSPPSSSSSLPSSSSLTPLLASSPEAAEVGQEESEPASNNSSTGSETGSRPPPSFLSLRSLRPGGVRALRGSQGDQVTAFLHSPQVTKNTNIFLVKTRSEPQKVIMIKVECCPVFAVQLLLGATQISLRLRNTLLDALASLDLKLSVGQRQGSPFLKCVVSI